MPSIEPQANASLADTAAAFAQWLDARATDLEPFRHEVPGDLDVAVEHSRPLQKMLWEDGWTKLGWATEYGGLGGSPVHRAYVLDLLSQAGYIQPELIGSADIVGSTIAHFSPHIAKQHLADGISGDAIWCQGFSEPDAGSDLAALRTKAVKDGDSWRIDGQKMWSSQAHLSDHCMLLARTGDADSRHRGLTSFWVPMDAPGVEVVPTMLESGRAETSEVFFDGATVPDSAIIGEVGGGWGSVMYLMQYERGAYAWGRQADLHLQLEHILAGDPDSFAPDAHAIVGQAYLALMAMRSQSGPTLGRLAAGETLGPEISVDKVLLGITEQAVSDATRDLIWPQLELSDATNHQWWRSRWSYSRVTTIYGGAAEVQRDIIGERLLGLPKGR